MRALVLGLTATVAGCCFSPAPVTPIAPPPASTVVPGGGPQLPSTEPGEAIAIAQGFADPLITHGLAGGPRDASAFGGECRGMLPMQPSLRVRLETSFPTLRFMARGDRDLTLVVRSTGGIARCNDDSDGLNPVVEGYFDPGEYDVYVGLYSAGAPVPYDLGITTSPALMPTTMLTATTAPTVVGTPIRSGTLTVRSAEGGIVDVGDVCTYSEVAIAPTSAGHDVRWTITCGTTIVYGAGNGGYGRTTDPSWPPGTLALDTSQSSVDTDPAFEWSATRVQLEDDDGGPLGAFLIDFAPPGGA